MSNQRSVPFRPPASTVANQHHALVAHQVVLMLESDVTTGLSTQQVQERIVLFGPNELPPAGTVRPLLRIARQLHHPLVYVLLVASGITLALGHLVDAGVIFGVIVVNTVVGYIQESRAEAALDALRSLVRTEARVRRDGTRQTIPSAELVPGDAVFVEAGDKVPADIRLVEVDELQLDESALTGESMPVPKEEVVLPRETPVADRSNMLYSSTLVTHGRGVGIVIATGPETEVGEIHRLVGTTKEIATPLTRKLSRFSQILTVAILALAAVTFVVGIVRGEQVADMARAAVALAVGAIPEGLPAAATITLAIGVNRMARRRAVVRRIPAVETLGSTTVICSDKTGTLTKNQMTVQAVWTPAHSYQVIGTGYRPEGAVLDTTGTPANIENDQALYWTMTVGAACNDAQLQATDGLWQVTGDPTEAAMLVAAGKAGIDLTRWTASFPRTRTVPFNSERQYMATVHDAGDHQLALIKGATERVLTLCSSQMSLDGSSTSLNSQAVLRTAEALAGDGLRVLATAIGTMAPEQPFEEDGHDRTLTLTGLVAMLDPPRPEAIAAVRACHSAGIDVKMITGDHPVTAIAIAEQIGITSAVGDEPRALTGTQLAALTPAEYSAAIDNASVFARVAPEQKLRLVQGLQSRGDVVAMTGDGVNDAPALRQADIGVAMGKGGTEVAKDAADMVLTDDDFATIEAAVEEGRCVFDNLTKFIAWTLPTNMGEGMTVLVAILVGGTLPLLPVQILWINMTTAVALGMMLAFEPKETDIMRRSPRDPRQPLLTGTLLIRVLVISVVLVSGAMWLFHWERSNGASIAAARTSALDLFVATEALYLFACRSLSRSVWQVGFLSNRWIILGVTVQALGQLAITYIPTMNTLFETAPIGAGAWARLLLLAIAGSFVVAIDKQVRRIMATRRR